MEYCLLYPVSYTHLDVYKRQISNDYDKLLLTFTVQKVRRWEVETAIAIHDMHQTCKESFK